jgi:hypothetical protein
MQYKYSYSIGRKNDEFDGDKGAEKLPTWNAFDVAITLELVLMLTKVNYRLKALVMTTSLAFLANGLQAQCYGFKSDMTIKNVFFGKYFPLCDHLGNDTIKDALIYLTVAAGGVDTDRCVVIDMNNYRRSACGNDLFLDSAKFKEVSENFNIVVDKMRDSVCASYTIVANSSSQITYVLCLRHKGTEYLLCTNSLWFVITETDFTADEMLIVDHMKQIGLALQPPRHKKHKR